MRVEAVAPSAAVLLLLACPSAPAQAEEALTIEAAVEAATRASPLVRRARFELDTARAGRVGAALLMPANPVLLGEAGDRRDTSGASPAAQGLEGRATLEQAIEIGGQRGSRIKEAEAGARAAEVAVRLAIVETRARARTAYIAVQIATAQVDNATRAQELARRVLDFARARVQLGAASDVEQRLAEAELARLGAERIASLRAVVNTTAELRRLVRVPPGRALVLSTSLVAPPPPRSSVAALTGLALTRRAELQLLDARRSELDATLSRLRHENVPTPILLVTAGNQQPGQTFVSGGVQLPIPLFRRHQGEIATARSVRDAVIGERALAELDVAIDVQTAVEQLERLLAEADLLERQALPAAEAAVGLVEIGWRAGKFDVFRLLQASREAIDARRRALVSLAAAWDAAIALDRAVGE